jgi:hypothetical protein
MLIPWYQETAANGSSYISGASTVFRNAPDVSAVADDVWISITGPRIDEGGLRVKGTSISAPLWAGYVALVNAANATAGKPSVGFLNPVLYGLASTNSSLEKLFNDVTSGCNTTICYPGQSVHAGTCVRNTYCATEGYDLTTGLGSPGPRLLGYLTGATAWGWNALSLSDGPTTITSIAGAPPGGEYTAWALDNTACANCDPNDHQVWRVDTTGTWTLVFSPGGIEIAVDPSGEAWLLDDSGTVFNTYGANGVNGNFFSPVATNAVPMSWIAPGPQNSSGPTAWAISKTKSPSGLDYTVWNYNVEQTNSWALASPPAAGLRIAVAPDTGNPWFVNHAGALSEGILEGFFWTYITNDMVGAGGPTSLDGGQFFGWQGTALSVGIGPNNQAWLVNNLASAQEPSDHQILYLSQYNALKDSAWSLAAGGAQSVTVSSSGIPWIIDHAGNAWYGVPGWQLGGGLEGDAY